MSVSTKYSSNKFYNKSTDLYPNNSPLAFKGWHPNSAGKSKQLNKMITLIKDPENKTIAISGHVKPDGDSISASIALAKLIKQATGKKADVFVFGDIPKKFSFLNTNKDVNVINVYEKKEFKAEKLAQMYGQYDIAISVDTALKRLFSQNYYEGIFNKAKTTIKLDHHSNPIKNLENNYAHHNYVDTDSDSATQIVMQMVDSFKVKASDLANDIKLAIYTGLMSDTNNLVYAKNDKTFMDVAMLIKNGVNNLQSQAKLEGTVPPIIHKIKQHLYNNIQFSKDGKIAYFIEDAVFNNLKTDANKQGYKEEIQEVISELLAYMLKLEGVEVCIKNSGTNFSIRSKNVDVSLIANKYGGGGHRNAAAFCVKKNTGQSNSDIFNQIISEYQNLTLSNNKRCIC